MRELTIIDGYNLIFTQGLDREATDLAHARERLVNLLGQYAALTGTEIILVFDAYRVKGGKGHATRQDGITVIFTAEGETADTVIERLSAHLINRHTVSVVTADWSEQRMVIGHGALRIPPRAFYQQVAEVIKRHQESIPTVPRPAESYLEERLTEEIRNALENWRRSKD
ncbi:NYN domain-containing protein [Thermodesulfitimonas autotrophica]|uniref:NYN domain-containing protein n=1 Tax=Thermodesulfitimonas autotrophica TaxID=1894989 RepID=UPI002FDF3B04